ncbi:MAG: DUF362 domain-containing protein [Clostridiaceae bacterium]
MKIKVSAIQCNSYDSNEIYKAAKDAISRIGFEIPEHKTVLIKPNVMTQNYPEQHTITHYTMIDALCRILKEKNNKILIGESISFYMEGLTEEAFRTAKLDRVAEKYGAVLLPFEKETLVEANGLYIPKVLLEADMVINACKLKTHGAMRLSGAIKNMFGCLPGGYKQRMHMRAGCDLELADVFLDIYDIVKPALNIMDAVIGLDGGPTALGKPVKVGRILASLNPAALDAIACRITGYEPENIPAMVRAKERHMIEDFDNIELLGDIVTMKFEKLIKGPLGVKYNKNSIFVKQTCVNLGIDDSKCTRCEKCIAECPVKAISHVSDKIILNQDKCINCYHCIYVCPENAVIAERSVINRVGWKLGKMLKL